MILVPTDLGILAAAGFIGFTTAITFPAILALPAVLSAAGDVSRTSAGMFTISYSCAIIIPTLSGALWDVTGRPWMAFVPLCVCAIALTVFGTIVTRQQPAGEKAPSPVTK
jgi:CP family cyanate transporter-like MFS transporter